MNTRTILLAKLATFRRKIHDFRDDATWPPARQTRRDSPAGSRSQGLGPRLRMKDILKTSSAEEENILGNVALSPPAEEEDIRASVALP